MNRIGSKRSAFILSPLLTICILGFVYALKGYFPFGSYSVSLGDAFAQIVPFLHQFYDLFHEGKSMLFDPYSFFGSSTFGNTANYVLSPINFFILLFPRDRIPEVFNLLYLFRVAVAAFACAVALSRLVKGLLPRWMTVLSVSYALSGYTLYAHQIPSWLDAMILFPFLILFIKNLLDGKSPIPFVLCLSLSLVVSFYLTIFVLLFLFIATALYCMFYLNRQDRGRGALRLGLGVLVSLGVAAVFLLPTLYQVTTSARTSFSFLASVIKGPIVINTWNKAAYFILSSFPIAVICRTVMKRKDFVTEDKSTRKAYVFFGLLLLMTLIQIPVDTINRIWHGGQYAMFPLRFGFIPIFVLILAAAFILEKQAISGEIKMSQRRSNIHRILFAIMALSSIWIGWVIYHQFFNKLYPQARYLSFAQYAPLLGFFLLFVGIFGVLLLHPRNYIGVRWMVFPILLVVQTTFILFFYTGIIHTHPFHEEEKLMKSLTTRIDAIPDNRVYRTKDLDEAISTHNYASVIHSNSIAVYSSMMNEGAYRLLKNLGYSTAMSSVHDNGGTLFSDALLGLKWTMTKDQLASPYSLISSSEAMNLYDFSWALKPLIQLPTLVQMDDSLQRVPDNRFDAQNQLFQLLGGEDDLFKIHQHVSDLDPTKATEISFPVGRKSAVYLDYPNGATGTFAYIQVNGEKLSTQTVSRVVSWYNPTGYLFPSSQVNGSLLLGVFENEEVHLILSSTKKVDANLTVGELEIAKAEAFFMGLQDAQKIAAEQLSIENNRISIENVKAGDTYMLSFPYDQGWKVDSRASSVEAEVVAVGGGFLSVSIREGEGTVNIVYQPKYFSLGLVISLLSLLVLLAYHFLRRRISNSSLWLRTVQEFAWKVDFLLASILVLLLYPLTIAVAVVFHLLK